MSYEPDAHWIATAVRAVPRVTGLHGGRFGEIVTHEPRRQVVGVRIRDEDITIAITTKYPMAAAELAAAVRAAAGVVRRPVHVIIADLTEPSTTDEEKEEVS